MRNGTRLTVCTYSPTDGTRFLSAGRVSCADLREDRGMTRHLPIARPASDDTSSHSASHASPAQLIITSLGLQACSAVGMGHGVAWALMPDTAPLTGHDVVPTDRGRPLVRTIRRLAHVTHLTLMHQAVAREEWLLISDAHHRYTLPSITSGQVIDMRQPEASHQGCITHWWPPLDASDRRP